MSLRKTIGAALCAILATACAKSNTVVITAEEWETERLRLALLHHERIDSVGLPLLAAAASQCSVGLKPTLGVRFLNAASVGLSDPKWAEAVLGPDERLQAVSVVPTMAGAAGLRKGDILMRVGAGEAPRGEQAAAEWMVSSQYHMVARRPLDITVLRAGQEIPLRLTPVDVCGYGLDSWEGADVYARTKEGQIRVTRGLLEFAPNDQELALVISHEIAHNTLRHKYATPVGDAATPVTVAAFNAVSDLIGANARGALVLADRRDPTLLAPIEQELEADYVGLYLMANAGMSIDGAAQFWRRLQEADPGDGKAPDDAERTHPTHAARFAAISDWIAEIKAKQAKGLPLVPEKHDWRQVLNKYE